MIVLLLGMSDFWFGARPRRVVSPHRPVFILARCSMSLIDRYHASNGCSRHQKIRFADCFFSFLGSDNVDDHDAATIVSRTKEN